MQKWSKFQFQSRMLKKEIVIVIFAIILVSMPSYVFAQEKPDGWLNEEERKMMMETGLVIEQHQMKIIFEVGKSSSIHVKHVIEQGSWYDRPRIIEILPGPHTNLSVTDDEGDRLAFSFDGDTFEESDHIILEHKLGCCDLIVEYDLDNFMELENNLWGKDMKYNFDVMVMVEDEIDLIFANSRPIEMSDASGINCVGCFMKLEYFDNVKSVNEEIFFMDEKYEIEFLTNGDISNVNFFGGGSEILNFDVTNNDQLVVLKIPFELFLNPFDVYWTEEDDKELNQTDKIRNTEFGQDETHVSLSFRTSNEGTISVLGATQEEHQKKLDRIEKTKALEKESVVVEEKRGVALPLPGQTSEENKNNQEVDKRDNLSFSEELLENDTSQASQNDFTVIGIMLGIVGAIIIGIVVKVKKN